MINRLRSLTSFPTGRPEPSEAVSPVTFASKVLSVRYSGITTPRIMVFISGIPDPVNSLNGSNFDSQIPGNNLHYQQMEE